MTYILRRNNWGETSAKWVEEGISAYGVQDVRIVNKDTEIVPDDDWCIRWATTSSVPGRPKVINKSGAIHKVYAKGEFRKTLADVGLAPKTVVNSPPSDDMYPVIVRPYHHSASADLYIASTEQEYLEAVAEIRRDVGGDGYYCSEFIDKDHEFRVFVVSGRVVSVSEKHPDDVTDASWGCAGNGVMEYVRWRDWDLDVIRVACEGMRHSGLDFGAVDVILRVSGSHKGAYVLEINTGPDTGPYHGQQIGAGIAHILKTGSRDFIEAGSKKSPYSYVHPILSNSAILD